MRAVSCFVAALAILTSAGAARAEDAYYRIPIRELTLTEGALPVQKDDASRRWFRTHASGAMLPRVVLDGPGEAYVGSEQGRLNPGAELNNILDQGRVHICAPKGQDLTGRLYLPNEDWTSMVAVKFRVAQTLAREDVHPAFLAAKQAHYEQLLSRGIPGAAWFRHEARLVRGQRNVGGLPPDQAPAVRPPSWSPLGSDLSQTYALFSGGRAVSENLQLDRLVTPRDDQSPEALETVALDTLRGITVDEIDWKSLIKDAQPKLDPLAAKIPADQHVVFFPSFQAAVTVADEAAAQGTPILRLAEPRSEDAGTLKRYERQLGLSMSGAARLLGPTLVDSVALTGSDPYYRTGTDVAVLFEAKNPSMLAGLVMAQIAAVAPASGKAEEAVGQVAGIEYLGRLSPDRSVSSYVATLDGAVVVTNSLEQLKRLAEVRKGQTPSIATLPEYTFFRTRYPRGDADETALVFISDPTIRRWCGPRWRIATSRRTRAAAVLAEMQASQLETLVRGNVEPGPLHTDLPLADGAKLSLEAGGVRSSAHGTLAFQTPIVEVPMAKVTKAEAQAYELWRDGYERNWTGRFDPIALRLGLKKERLEADLTVMPLILGTRYREFTEISRGATIPPDAGDPHDALAHLGLAINQESRMFQQANSMAGTFVKGISLGWLGPAVSVYADDDPFWKELAKVPRDERPKFFETQGHRTPIALHAEVSNGFKLTAFLTGLRAFVEQTAPGMTIWEPLTYKDEGYVKVSPTERARSQNRHTQNWAIYYAASGDALIVSPNEQVLHRAIDRVIARRKAKETGQTLPPPARPWLGGNLSVEVDRGVLDVLNGLNAQAYQEAMQVRAWGSLPILNEWRRLYPDQDPVKVHERAWGIRLVCPGGGEYVWNDEWKTMESSVYGHPGQPKPGPVAPPVLSTFTHGSFGITFEHEGLRARVRLDREK